MHPDIGTSPRLGAKTLTFLKGNKMNTATPTATVHFHCDNLPRLELGGGTGLTPAKYVRFLMELTGEEVDVCIDLYDKIVRQAMAGHFKHLDHEKFGPFNKVMEVIRHQGGRRRDVSGMRNGYCMIDTSEDVTSTILFFAPFNASWHLAKVTTKADRPCNVFGGQEAMRWKANAITALYPVFREDIVKTERSRMR